VYVHQGVLSGLKFDPERLEVRGAPTTLLDDVAANSVTGAGQFDYSATGTLVYSSGKSSAAQWGIAWLDSSSKIEPLLRAPAAYTLPRISPDGKRLALVGDGPDIYVYDMERDTTIRVTFTGRANAPIWAPNGKHLVFQSTSNGFQVNWVRSDGSGEPQRLLESPNNTVAWSFAQDGRMAVFENSSQVRRIFVLPLDLADPERPKPGKPEPFPHTADETLPSFSPDGRWIAYVSIESGRGEIYVRPSPPGNGGKWQISNGGALSTAAGYGPIEGRWLTFQMIP
jgi:eukaryotic-like serine/threonine-protein kinase